MDKSGTAGRWCATHTPISVASSAGGCWTRRVTESRTIRGGRRSERYCCSSKTASCSSALPAAAGVRSSGTIGGSSPSPAGDGPRATARSSGQTTLHSTRRQGTFPRTFPRTGKSPGLAVSLEQAPARVLPTSTPVRDGQHPGDGERLGDRRQERFSVVAEPAGRTRPRAPRPAPTSATRQTFSPMSGASAMG